MSKRKTVESEILAAMRDFLRDLQSGKPIQATHIIREETPDGPLHEARKVVLRMKRKRGGE